MIDRLVSFSLKHRGWVVAVYALLGAWGWWALGSTPIDAIPDLSDNQAIVFTEWPGHSPQEVEDQVTYPLSRSLQGLPSVRTVRSQSAFGFSMIYVIFDDGADLYFSRTRVLERLNLSTASLPPGVTPSLGPDATGVGHVFWYTLDSPTRSLTELRSLQDWFVRYQLASVPGVAEVASVGGKVRQYQIDVNPYRLRDLGISLADVVRAVQDSNLNVSGNVLEANGSWSIVRGVGLVERVDDLAAVPLRAAGGVPVRLDQVAEISIGAAFRTASLVSGTHEAVGGVVIARAGADTRAVIAAVKSRVDEIRSSLPADVTLVPFYDRSQLIERTADTLRSALIEEILLVTLAHVLFLLHARSILVVTLPLPLAVLLSFLTMRYAGVTSNVMSLSGIAIAIGVLVDAGIVVTENAFRYLETHRVDVKDRRAVAAGVLASTRLVARPIFFSMAVIVLAFLPVFALTGQEGKLFHPLALTKTVAVLAATLMAVTLVPVLCALLLAGRLHAEDRNPLMRGLRALYRPALRFALGRPVATVSAAALLFVAALAIVPRLGTEFMPALNEGDLVFMPIADPSVSLEENTRIAETQNAALLRVPEVETVVAKVGRADTSTDPAPPNMTETIVHLKPRAAWRPGVTLDSLRAEMGRAAELPGVANIWTMPIINRIDMLTTGIRSELGIKIFGSDLDTLQRVARDVATAVATVPGASNVYPEALTNAQYLNIRVDRSAASRYGLSVAAVQDVITHAIGETTVGTTIEGRERYPIRVRYGRAFRASAADVGATLVTAPNGAQVPLSAVAAVSDVRGPFMISSEDGLLVATVLLNVQGRDVGGFVRDARTTVSHAVALPPGYVVRWSGRYESQEHARRRLQLVVPAALVLIFGLLWWTYRSALEAIHVLIAVPFALTGGVFLVWALGYHLSVAVVVGFIALFGTAVQTGVVMVIYLDEAVARLRATLGRALTRGELRAAVVDGALLRLRPKVMTVSTVVAGLLPIMWSGRPGAEIMKPIAAPVLGGMVSSLLHVLIVTPVLYVLLHGRRLETASVDANREISSRSRSRAGGWIAVASAAMLVAAAAWWAMARSGPDEHVPPAGRPVRVVESGGLKITLLSADGVLHQGRDQMWLEFRDETGRLVDVGDARSTASMTMPGMPMSGGLETSRTPQPGRYAVSGEFGMAGSWRFSVTWRGRAGTGTVTFESAVQ